jgi:hypothetical protein
MSGRPRHTDPHIEKALCHAERLGWRVQKSSGGHAHCWGRILCPFSNWEGCIIFVYSTPRVPMNHARQIVTKVESCPHRGDAVQGDGL